MKRNQNRMKNNESGTKRKNRHGFRRCNSDVRRVKIFSKAVAVIFYCTILCVGFCEVNSVRDETYEKAIEYIKKDNYKLATLRFEELQVINYKSFPTDVVNGRDFDKYYKNSAVLYAYTQAVREYRSESSLHTVDKWLRVMPEDYNGELSEEIDAFRKAFEAEYKNTQREI